MSAPLPIPLPAPRGEGTSSDDFLPETEMRPGLA
jgi:hypothetical protein